MLSKLDWHSSFGLPWGMCLVPVHTCVSVVTLTQQTYSEAARACGDRGNCLCNQSLLWGFEQPLGAILKGLRLPALDHVRSASCLERWQRTITEVQKWAESPGLYFSILTSLLPNKKHKEYSLSSTLEKKRVCIDHCSEGLQGSELSVREHR